jgi:glutaredoxin
MKLSRFRVACCLVALFIPVTAPALTVVECVDADGHSSFRDKCPPGMSVKSTKELRGKPQAAEPGVEEVANTNPVVLFSAPNCDACDLVRNQLERRKVPFAEKDSSTDAAIQAELAAVTGGPLTVPTVTVGAQKFTGYSKKELESALNQAGYP